MARPQTITDEQILEAALAVFKEHGLNAPTSEIAERAGISEGTIYRRYPTKVALIVAALCLPKHSEIAAELTEMVGKNTLLENLVWLVDRYVGLHREIAPKLMMLLSSGIPMLDVFAEHELPPPVQAIRTVAAYLHAERNIGRVGNCDADVVGRMVLGTCHMYGFFEANGFDKFAPIARETFVRNVADLIHRAVMAQPDTKVSSDAS